MTEGNMKKLSLAEIRALKDSGQLRKQRADAPELDLPDEFWANAQVIERENKKSVHLRLDPDVFRYFFEESGGRGHIRKMQDILATYVKAHQHNQSQNSQ